MHLTYRNVNEAFYRIVSGIASERIPTVRTSSRNGDVLHIPEPVIITYINPRERVLFNPARDANPFFHLYESLWMLAGRNSVDSVAYYASNIRNYSDNGMTLNGAYGYRWRKARVGVDDWDMEVYGVEDQLKLLVNHLKAKPDSRRAVLQMWNVEDDLLRVNDSKDVCCNLSAVFAVRKEVKGELQPDRFKRVGSSWKYDTEGRKLAEDLSMSLYGTREHVRFSTDSQEWYVFNPAKEYKYLDMTVYNRSNDLIWGTLGANVVHFSMLQEYMACCLGLDVGDYHQISCNQHVYLNNWKPEEWLRHSIGSYPQTETIPLLVHDPKVFDREVGTFVTHRYGKEQDPIEWQEPFLRCVAEPMCLAFHMHKCRDYPAARYWLQRVEAKDWQRAGIDWIYRRELKHKEKTNGV